MVLIEEGAPQNQVEASCCRKDFSTLACFDSSVNNTTLEDMAFADSSLKSDRRRWNSC